MVSNVADYGQADRKLRMLQKETQAISQNQSSHQTMNMKIDLKSGLCGLAFGIVAMLAIGAGTSSDQTGRYQVAIGNSSNGSGVVVMVDTQTGKAWGATFKKTGGPVDSGNQKKVTSEPVKPGNHPAGASTTTGSGTKYGLRFGFFSTAYLRTPAFGLPRI